ncbi:hypothetical protein AAFN47_18265 [Hoeflea sp. CAU 1731]
MRRLALILIPTLLVPAAAVAQKSIIEIKSPEIQAGAILEFHCKSCSSDDEDKDDNQPAVQVTETSVDGDRKAVQVDNMMGGSPVRTFRDLDDAEPPVVVQKTQENEGSAVTFSGGGDFGVEEVGPSSGETVDEGSRTSSVNMENAEHDNVDGPSNSGPEILELRPGATVVPQDQ